MSSVNTVSLYSVSAHMIGVTLVSAYACSPDAGSEAGAGWHSLRAALDVSREVVLITQSSNVRGIESALPEADCERVKIVGIDLGKGARALRARVPFARYVYYFFWQMRLAREAKRLERQTDISVALHATFASDWLWSGLARLRQTPVVWGPVGGVSRTPARLWRFLGVRGVAGELSRRSFQGLFRWVVDRQFARKVRLVLAQNEDVAERFAASSEVIVLPNAAIEVGDQQWQGEQSDYVVGVGRLVAWKGWRLAIEALAQTDEQIRLRIFGRGPELHSLEKLARRLGISHRVELGNHVPRETLLEELSGARALLHTSFHDACAWSVAEALTIGVPVIALDLAGPAVLLRGSGCHPIDSQSENLVGSIAAALVDPPSGTTTDIWRAEVYRRRLGELLVRAAR